MNKILQALIFDCDGVLVDTERDGHRAAFNQAFVKKGLNVELLFEVFLWICFKSFQTTWSAKVVHFSHIVRLVLYGLLIHIHSTNKIFCHSFTSFLGNRVVC